MDDTQNGESVGRSGGAVVSRMVDDQQSEGNEDSVAATKEQSVSLLVTMIIKRTTIASAANASIPVYKNFHGCIQMIGQKGICQEYKVNNSVCYARSGYCRQAKLKVGKHT
jgi:hypothetical protein